MSPVAVPLIREENKMKRILDGLVVTILSVFVLSGMASASVAYTTWTADISTLPSYINSQNFNVQYDVSSIEPATFTADLYVSSDNGVTYSATPCATQDTNYDAKNVYGGSGYFVTYPACVSKDGSYMFKLVVTKDGSTDPAQTKTTSTTVDTIAPNPPSYGGKTVSGDTYVLSFTAPSSDVSYINIYASASLTYVADSSTLVGQELSVTPGQAYKFSYTAPNSSTRYFSLQAYDLAGNSSVLVGDPGEIVTPVITTPSAQPAATPTTSSSSSSEQVLGATTSPNTNSSGQINAPGSSSSKNSTNNGKVLGTTKSKTKNAAGKGWDIALAIVLSVILLYMIIAARTGRNLLFKKPSKK